MPHDLVIRGGTVLDGDGNEFANADVVIADGKIVRVDFVK